MNWKNMLFLIYLMNLNFRTVIIVNMIDFLKPFLVLFLILLIMTPIAVIIGLIQKRKEKYLTDLGQKYNLEYRKGENIDLMKGFRSRLFKYTRTIDIKDVFIGEYQEHKFSLFTKIFYTPKFLTSAKDFTIASCEFTGTEFPHILLKSKKVPLYQNSEKLDTKIFLEQEYLKNFDLFCPRDYEIEAMQIFTEELTGAIQDISKNFSIEFGGDRFFIYINKNIHKKKNEKDFAKILDIVKQIIEKTDGLLFRLRDDFEVLDEYYKR